MTGAPVGLGTLALAPALMASACSSAETTEAGAPHAEDAASEDAGAHAAFVPTFEPTFSAIYREVILTSNCTLGLCHGEGARGGSLELYPRDEAFLNLVDSASESVECGPLGLSLVNPGAPEQSLLYLKLSPEPPCGRMMPPDAPLTQRQREQIYRWIELGAPDD